MFGRAFILCACTFDHLPVDASVGVGLCVHAHTVRVSAVGRILEWIMSCSVAWQRNGSIIRYVQDCQRTAERGERSAHKLTFWFWRVRMCGWQQPEMDRRKMARLRYSESKIRILAAPFDSFEHVFSCFFFKELSLFCVIFYKSNMRSDCDIEALNGDWKMKTFRVLFILLTRSL